MQESKVKASLLELLMRTRSPATPQARIFAYGSLIWNPGFLSTRVACGRIFGYHRSMCVLSHEFRGTPSDPGLVLGLSPGGSCQGVVLHIDPADLDNAVDQIYRRELRTGAYLPKLVRVHQAGASVALTFVATAKHPQSALDIGQEKRLEMIACSRGTRGSTLEYLRQSVDCLAAAGIRDNLMERLLRTAMSCRAAKPQTEE